MESSDFKHIEGRNAIECGCSSEACAGDAGERAKVSHCDDERGCEEWQRCGEELESKLYEECFEYDEDQDNDCEGECDRLESCKQDKITGCTMSYLNKKIACH